MKKFLWLAVCGVYLILALIPPQRVELETDVSTIGAGFVGTRRVLLVGGGGSSEAAGAVTIANGADTTEGSTTDAANCASPRTVSGCLAQIDADIKGPIPAGTNTIGTVNFVSQYPVTAIPYTASATGTTGATTATLTGAVSVTTYICGFSIRANATAAATGNATVTGIITGTLNYTQWTAPNASGLGVTEQIYTPCVPASAVNTSVAVVSAAPGTGGVVSVTAWGYKL